jgi:hypothetical protein
MSAPKTKRNETFPHSYFISKSVDESKCVEEATRRFHSTGKRSRIHLHKFTETCVDTCYLAPQPKE